MSLALHRPSSRAYIKRHKSCYIIYLCYTPLSRYLLLQVWKSRTGRMKLFTAWRAATICILPIYLELVASATTTQKQLYRVPRHARVTDSYFVHLDPDASWSTVEELIGSLQVMNDDLEQPEFVAKVQGVVTQAAFGFSAQLSSQAVKKVRQTVLTIQASIAPFECQAFQCSYINQLYMCHAIHCMHTLKSLAYMFVAV